VPLVNPLMVCVVKVEAKVVGAWAVNPMKGVTVYPVIGSPPVDEGGLHVSETWPFPERPDTPVGDDGTVTGVTAEDGAEGALNPALVMAVTVNV
jgi:hypothetical protein